MVESCDFLVIGSGLAGLRFALEVAPHGKVVVVTKRAMDEGNTRYAQGGIAAAWTQDDSWEDHERDTLVAGAGLCRREVVARTVREAKERVSELIALGVGFDSSGGAYDLHIEGGHSSRRVLHAKDATGAEIMRALLERAKAHPNIVLREGHMAIDLITEGWLARRQNDLPPARDRVLGAYVLDTGTAEVTTISARVTALCTGGAGKVYLYTTNPDIASGDGIAMAYRAGARVANMEFVQFHPTCLYHPEARNFLVTEAMRGEGGILQLESGERFMGRYDARKELAPRDIVARAIDAELKRTGDDCVYLDMTHLGASALVEKFPNVYATCLQFGIDITEKPIPVVPAAHYFCGGVVTDLAGETDIRNLFAIGETACTGLHGANRLASNSLAECMVFGRRAALSALAEESPPQETLRSVAAGEVPAAEYDPDPDPAATRELLWSSAGIERTAEGLANLAASENPLVRLIGANSLAREETRGAHHRKDFPEIDHALDFQHFVSQGDEAPVARRWE